MPAAVSFAERATDKQVRCLGITPMPRGETICRRWNSLCFLSRFSGTISRCACRRHWQQQGGSFCRVPAGTHKVGWHNPPHTKLVTWLTGEVEFETSDGDIRRLTAGSAVLAEDTTGKRHSSRHPPESQLLMFIDLTKGTCSNSADVQEDSSAQKPEPTVLRMTGIGASRPLPRAQAKVSFPIT